MRRQEWRRTQLLDDLKETGGYCKLKEEALDCTLWWISFGICYGPVAKQRTERMQPPNRRLVGTTDCPDAFALDKNRAPIPRLSNVVRHTTLSLLRSTAVTRIGLELAARGEYVILHPPQCLRPRYTKVAHNPWRRGGTWRWVWSIDGTTDGGQTEVLGQNLVPVPLSNKNLVLIGLGQNPGIHGKRPATNPLCHGRAFLMITDLNKHSKRVRTAQ